VKVVRTVREDYVDVVATMAVLGGVRMPRQCEGAPVYPVVDHELFGT